MKPVEAAPSRLPAVLAALATVVCLAFAAYTRHAWEDYLITFRASLNLASGHGLVYQPGERVHSFTSPLGTLLPAIFALGGGEGIETRALWGLRLVSAAAIATAVHLIVRHLGRDGMAAHFAALAALLCVFDPKIVDFAVNGMESGLLVFFVIWCWAALAGGRGPVAIGLAVAGLQWTRPDGFVFATALGLAWWALGDGPARERFARLGRAAAIAFVLYLPWLLFAWGYYGSPIPHTIIAKQSLVPVMDELRAIALYPVRLFTGRAVLGEIFLPAYWFFGGWPGGLTWFSRVLATGAALAWLWPALPRAGRVASAALFLGGLYVEYIPRSPWYYPAWQALAVVSWGYLFGQLTQSRRPAAPPFSILAPVTRILGLSFVIVQLGLFAAVALQMRTQQTVIENGHRREIGLWLRNQARSGDRVYLEPLGYIGYYSGLKMLDHPGLSAREVVAARREGYRHHAAIIRRLEPEWLILRPDQIDTIQAEDPALLSAHYAVARVFDVRADINAASLLPGRGYLYFDAVFVVYARRPTSAHGR